MSKDSHETLLKQLKNPFDPKLVKWRQAGGGTKVAYIDARDVMKRLDDVMGIAGWSDEYIEVKDGFICKLSLKIGDDWIPKSNGANNTKIESLKGGVSSALKRAGVEWGIGRYLYYMPKWANDENIDRWPKWAFPDNNIENWEDVAELEAEKDTGMDEEEGFSSGMTIATQIASVKSLEELRALVETMDANTQRFSADAISNKTDELTRE